MRGVALALPLAVSLASVPHAYGYAFLLVPGGQGIAQHWEVGSLSSGRVAWQLATRVTAALTGDRAVLDVAKQGFAHWEEIEESAMAFAFAGTTRRSERSPSDGVNLITLGSSQSLGTGVLAATFLTSNADGVLTDADIVVSRDARFDTSATSAPDEFDLESILTHEIGHLIGLEHSGLVRATMAPFTDRGDLHQRTPESDDRIGAGLLYPVGGFPAGRGSLAGKVTEASQDAVFLAHVVATTITGRAVASTYSLPDGTYRIDGLEPDVYLVHAERLDGPILPRNVAAFREGFDRTETMEYGTSFH